MQFPRKRRRPRYLCFSYEDRAYKLTFGDEIEEILEFDPLTAKISIT